MSGNQILWKDLSIRKHVFGLISFVGLLIFPVLFFKEITNPRLTLDYVSIILIISYFLITLILLLRSRLSLINASGIRMGNSPNDKFTNFNFKQKAIFFDWNSIKEVKIFGREIRRPTYMDAINILSIKTKNNKKYECFIANPKGFVEVLKRLKKNHLISKDSKYK